MPIYFLGGIERSLIEQTTIYEDDCPEPSLIVTAFKRGILELRQGDDHICINSGTVSELAKELKRLGQVSVDAE